MHKPNQVVSGWVCSKENYLVELRGYVALLPSDSKFCRTM